MFKFVNEKALIVAVSLSFFTFGFVLGADFFQITFKQVIACLVASAVCGVTILVMEYSRSKKQLTAARDRLTA